MKTRAALLTLLLVPLAGCGSGGDTTSAPAATTPSVTETTPVSAGGKVINVDESEWKVVPETTHIPLGKVTFIGHNKGTIPHVLELEGPGLENETGEIAPGASQSLGLTLRNKGHYILYCSIDGHKKKGMVAKVTVG